MQAVADWDIGRFLKKTADIRQMESLQQEISAFQDSLEITGVVTGLYFDVLQAQLEIQILQTRLAYLNKHLEILQVLWKAGTIQKLDILQTRSIINKANEDIMQKELIDKQLKYAMSRIMGFSSTDEFAVDTLSMVLPPPGIIDQVPDTWLENHPQVRGFQNLYEKELLMKNEVRAAYLPHIQVISGYTLDGDPTGDGDYTLLSIGATIPVFSWERKDSDIRDRKNLRQSFLKWHHPMSTQLPI